MLTITHVTTEHSRSSSRIFFKMCRSIAHDHKTFLVVCDGRGNQISSDVHIIGLARYKNRLLRFIFAPFLVLIRCFLLPSNIYHFHDPNLILVGAILSLCGRKCIFDSHEDIPLQILSKGYLSISQRRFFSLLAELSQLILLPLYSAIVCPTQTIAAKLKRYNPNCTVICNYPSIAQFSECSDFAKPDTSRFIYVGSLSKNRGVENLYRVSERLPPNVTIDLYGKFDSDGLYEQLESTYPNNQVIYHGYIDQDLLVPSIAGSIGGIVTLLPLPNYIEALPIKMFEYMASSIPVIASDFPIWRDIVDSCNCGILVDPSDCEQILDALLYLLRHPYCSFEMGKRGHAAIHSTFNWEHEYQRLLALYSSLC